MRRSVDGGDDQSAPHTQPARPGRWVKQQAGMGDEGDGRVMWVGWVVWVGGGMGQG